MRDPRATGDQCFCGQPQIEAAARRIADWDGVHYDLANRGRQAMYRHVAYEVLLAANQPGIVEDE